MINVSHRYLIQDCSSGERTVDTANSQDRAVRRADSLTYQTGRPMQVKDKDSRDARGRAAVIYATTLSGSRSSTQVH